MYRQLLTILMVLAAHFVFSQKQTGFPLKKLPIESWKIEGSKWQTAKDFTVFPNSGDSKKFKLETGKDIIFGKDGAGLISSNISTKDVKLRFEFALNSNSSNTLYIQGKYGIALNQTGNPIGSILGEKTILPAKLAGKEAGLWQVIEIVFSSKSQTKPALIEKVVINGLTLQQNIFLNRPSADAPFIGDENPLAIVNHTGQIAIRNVEYLPYETGNPITVSDLNYTIQETSDWDKTFEAKDTKPETGKSNQLTADVKTNFRRFILTYTGKMNVKKTDKYALTIDYMGVGNLKIDGKDVVGSAEYLYRSPQTGFVELTAGEHTFEYRYQRIWWRPALGLFVSSAEIRPYPLHPASSLPDPDPVSEIFVNPTSNKAEMIRSFVMFEDKKRTHVISVGMPQNVNYSFDLNQGALLNIWRGNFANVTEMWHERGEPQLLFADGLSTKWDGKPPFVVGSDLSKDSMNVEKELIFKGYRLDASGVPTYKYEFNGSTINQTFLAFNNGLKVTVEAENSQNLNYKVAEGKEIIEIKKGYYQIADKFISLDPKSKPILRTSKAGQEILLPLNSQINYSIHW